MLMYLLLRDNKQSGPFSLDDLKTMGLKAYDLVWVEGRSAAWRYTSELDELKPFAPAAEEQPFDRFYKRPLQSASGSSSQPASVSSPQSDSGPSSIAVFSSAISPARTITAPIQLPGKRFIYVTMPASGSSTFNSPSRGSASRETPPREPAKIAVAIPDYRFEDDPASVGSEDKSSHTAAIPGRTVEYNPQEKKKGDPRPLRLLIAAGGVLVLLITGIFIGLSLNKGWVAALDSAHPDKQAGSEKIATIKQSAAAPQQTSQPPAQTFQQPVSSAALVQPDAQQSQPADSNKMKTELKMTDPANANASQPAATNPVVAANSGLTAPNSVPARASVAAKTTGGNASVVGKPSGQKRKPSLSGQKALALMPPVTRDSSIYGTTAFHRESVHRSDISEKTPDNTVDKDALKNSIANLIYVSNNGYNVGAFGGISDLQVTVSNRSAYPLDLVVVEVRYIQANKKVYKTESLNFRGIGAGSALMLQAPGSSRGVKVQYKVTLVNSKELGLSYSSL